MTRRIRRFIFLIFVVFFVAVSAGVVLFAQGFRFDFGSLKVVKTGGIFIDTSVDGAKIYVNDKYAGATNGILKYTSLVSGLIPKNYNIFIYKENYYPWNKVVEIKNGMVAELNNIILFPLELKKIKVVEIPSQIFSEFAVNNGKLEIKNAKAKTVKIYNLANSELLTKETFKSATTTNEIISPDKNKKLIFSDNKLWVDKDLVASFELPVDFFDWFDDSEHLLWLSKNELTIAELDNRGGKRNSVKYYLNIDSPVFWDRDNSDFYFFDKTLKTDVLYKINLKI
ncbi:MAG: PEGA domain-containing protein [Candidatus Azambacteria bacterium]|nr:PEGA domain-containing protein [Candidatus Azambacteria bacterium]